MAPDIATKHNYCHLKQGKISKKQFQKAEETVRAMLVYTKNYNVSNSSMSECDKSSEYN